MIKLKKKPMKCEIERGASGELVMLHFLIQVFIFSTFCMVVILILKYFKIH